MTPLKGFTAHFVFKWYKSMYGAPPATGTEPYTQFKKISSHMLLVSFKNHFPNPATSEVDRSTGYNVKESSIYV